MNSKLNALADDIIDKAQEKVKEDIESISEKIQVDFKDKAREALLIYYFGYYPVLYQRTFNLFGGVVNENVSIAEYGGGISFDASGMSAYSDGGDKGLVVQNFLQGIHGREEIAVSSPNPVELLSEFQNSYKGAVLDGYFSALGYNVN